VVLLGSRRRILLVFRASPIGTKSADSRRHIIISILTRGIRSLPATLTVPKDSLPLVLRGDFMILVRFGGIVLRDLVFVQSCVSR